MYASVLARVGVVASRNKAKVNRLNSRLRERWFHLVIFSYIFFFLLFFLSHSEEIDRWENVENVAPDTIEHLTNKQNNNKKKEKVAFSALSNSAGWHFFSPAVRFHLCLLDQLKST